LFGCVDMHSDEFFVLSPNLQTRGHHYKLFKQRSSTRVRSSFFTERVINIWNSLPSETVNFSSLGAFKRSLQLVNFDEFLRYSLIDQVTFGIFDVAGFFKFCILYFTVCFSYWCN